MQISASLASSPLLLPPSPSLPLFPTLHSPSLLFFCKIGIIIIIATTITTTLPPSDTHDRQRVCFIARSASAFTDSLSPTVAGSRGKTLDEAAESEREKLCKRSGESRLRSLGSRAREQARDGEQEEGRREKERDASSSETTRTASLSLSSSSVVFQNVLATPA